MPEDFNEILRDATELSEHERATLAGLLIESLEGEADPGVEASWAAEIERRMAELEAGTVKTIPREEVRQRLLDRKTRSSSWPSHIRYGGQDTGPGDNWLTLGCSGRRAGRSWSRGV